MIEERERIMIDSLLHGKGPREWIARLEAELRYYKVLEERRTAE